MKRGSGNEEGIRRDYRREGVTGKEIIEEKLDRRERHQSKSEHILFQFPFVLF